MPDWIETFVSDTAGIQSPESFRLWAGITTIAGALERRVWTETDRGVLYPNLFVLLTGFPASGKTLMINECRRYWTGVQELHVGSDNPTRRSFLDELGKAARSYTYVNGAVSSPVIFSALNVPSSELGVLLGASDKDFFATLTKLYDNEDMFVAPRSSTSSVSIERPTVNFLAGATPDYLGELFPDVAWGQGFTSRILFIYGTEIHDPQRDVFRKRQRATQTALQQDLKQIFSLVGEVSWESAAQRALNDWFSSRLDPRPEHPRLTHYIARRPAHILKLSMISAVSYHKSLVVTLADFERAKKWLLSAEQLMPDVFRAIKQKSDDALLQELHQYLYSLWSSVVRANRVPIPEETAWKFLQERTTSDKIKGLIESATRSGLIRQGTKPGTIVPIAKSIQSP